MRAQDARLRYHKVRGLVVARLWSILGNSFRGWLGHTKAEAGVWRRVHKLQVRWVQFRAQGAFFEWRDIAVTTKVRLASPLKPPSCKLATIRTRCRGALVSLVVLMSVMVRAVANR